MNIQLLESQYLKAKIAYYDGTPIMSDAAFDFLEQELKALGSKVIEQVGSKRKDFDFAHPTPMKSLGKFQMEANDGIINYCENEFMEWINKRISILRSKGISLTTMFYGPKFDGSAINIIYHDGKLESVLTRGSGKEGKDCTDRFRKHLPDTLFTPGNVIEIRCEAVMKLSTFLLKYSSEYANARNLVAGIIGRDDIDTEMVGDINLVPLHYIVDGKHHDIQQYLSGLMQNNPIFADTEISQCSISKDNYLNAANVMIAARDKNEFPLDGIVFTLPFETREILGENDHDPEWAIAIKFVPEESVTTVESIEWNIGKTGEFTPVVVLKPVQLAGTTVKRASGYNAGFIIKNRIQPGTIVKIHKAGDIIPEISEVVWSPED